MQKIPQSMKSTPSLESPMLEVKQEILIGTMLKKPRAPNSMVVPEEVKYRKLYSLKKM